eukprot:5344120-Pyramimonas_sp.AAC.1
MENEASHDCSRFDDKERDADVQSAAYEELGFPKSLTVLTNLFHCKWFFGHGGIGHGRLWSAAARRAVMSSFVEWAKRVSDHATPHFPWIFFDCPHHPHHLDPLWTPHTPW